VNLWRHETRAMCSVRVYRESKGLLGKGSDSVEYSFLLLVFVLGAVHQSIDVRLAESARPFSTGKGDSPEKTLNRQFVNGPQ